MDYIEQEDLNEKGYILQNKLNITDYEQLQQKEEKISKKNMIKMYQCDYFKDRDVLNLSSLQEIHKILFQDVYNFAGELRNFDISKDGFKFAHFRFLISNADYVINEYKQNKTIENCIELYASMNVIHPFQEGNGRSTRFWFDLVLKQDFNKVVDWNNILPRHYLQAMKLSHSDTSKLYELISNNLIDVDTLDEYTFFRGIDRSYEYENLNYYKTEFLANNDCVVEVEDKKEKNKGMRM